MHIFDGYLVFQSSRDEYIHILLQPGAAVQDFTAHGLGLFLVYAAISIGYLHQLGAVQPILAFVGIGFLVNVVPAGNSHDLAAHLAVQLSRILSHIAKTLEAGTGFLRFNAQFFQGFTKCIYYTIAGSFGSPQRASHAHRFAGNKPGASTAMDSFKFIQHPQHVLGIGHYVRSRYVQIRSHRTGHFPYPAPA